MDDAKTVCLYGELDPVSGSIPQHISAVNQVVRQLKIACLCYDQVIVNTSAIFEHSLILPTFEHLYPFVKSGYLWTSTSANDALPIYYLHQRAERIFGEPAQRGIAAKRWGHIHPLLERWQHIVPEQWSLYRNISGQIKNASSNVHQYITQLTIAESMGDYLQKSLLHRLEEQIVAGVFDRDALLAYLGSLRQQAKQSELATMSLLIQAEYMIQGTANKSEEIVLYPGVFAQRVLKQQALLQTRDFPIDMTTIPLIKQGMQQCGMALDNLLSWPIQALYDLASSSEWQQWRAYVLAAMKDEVDDVHLTLSLLMKGKSLESVLDCAVRELQWEKDAAHGAVHPMAYTSTILLPNAWAVANWSLNGTLNQEQATTTRTIEEESCLCFVLDMQRHCLYPEADKACAITLESSQLHVLALIATAPKEGLPNDYLKQLDKELDLLKHDNNHWQAQTDDTKRLQHARLNRLNVLKTRLNKRLKPLDLKIEVQRHHAIWHLVMQKGGKKKTVMLSLQGTVWQEHHMVNKTMDNHLCPVTLSLQLQRFWDILSDHYPNFVSVDTLARAIETPRDNVRAQVSDIIYRLKKVLHNHPVNIMQNYLGEYLLINNKDPSK